MNSFKSLLIIVYLIVLLVQSFSLEAVNSTYLLDDSSFDELVQNGNYHNWFVMFHTSWCPHCKRLSPIFQEMAKNLSSLINFGVIDCEKSPTIKDRFSIMGYPTLIYFSNNKMYEYPEKSRDIHNMTEFVMEGYLKYEGEEIPLQPNKLKSFKKHLSLFFQKVWNLINAYPVYSLLFAIGTIAFIIISFYCTDYIFNKLEERQMKQLNKKKN